MNSARPCWKALHPPRCWWRRCAAPGPKPSRASLHNALENLGRVDLGGLVLDYSPTDHTGLDFVDLSIISAGGKFRR